MADLSYVKAWDSFELRVGVRKVFWGVTEAQHLVDIINQLDFVEDPTGKTKLGQPMVNAAWITEAGTFELSVMPFFRNRTFPGVSGHFRSEPPVNTDKTTYEAGAGQFNPDAAFRWSDHLGNFDLGYSHFYGTYRLPTFISATTNGIAELDPYYPLTHQDVWTRKLRSVRYSARSR